MIRSICKVCYPFFRINEHYLVSCLNFDSPLKSIIVIKSNKIISNLPYKSVAQTMQFFFFFGTSNEFSNTIHCTQYKTKKEEQPKKDFPFSVAKSVFNIKKIIHTHSIVNSLLNEQQNYSVAKNDANCFFFFFFF